VSVCYPHLIVSGFSSCCSCRPFVWGASPSCLQCCVRSGHFCVRLPQDLVLRTLQLRTGGGMGQFFGWLAPNMRGHANCWWLSACGWLCVRGVTVNVSHAYRMLICCKLTTHTVVSACSCSPGVRMDLHAWAQGSCDRILHMTVPCVTFLASFAALTKSSIRWFSSSKPLQIHTLLFWGFSSIHVS